MSALVKYDAACRAIAAAKSVDEAKGIRNTAEAMRAYARQAKNKELEVDAAEIRIRAERRVGQLLQAQKQAVGLHEGGRPAKTRADKAGVSAVKLAEAGIDYKTFGNAVLVLPTPRASGNQMEFSW